MTRQTTSSQAFILRVRNVKKEKWKKKRKTYICKLIIIEVKRISIERTRREDISEFPAKADASMKSSQDQNDEKSSENFIFIKS